jgi:hypothetical protein
LRAAVFLAIVASPLALAASGPPPAALVEVAAKAGVNDPIAAWCAGVFQPGRPQAYAVAAGKRYLIVNPDGKSVELGAFKDGPELSCYTPAQARKVDASIKASEGIHGRVRPRWKTTVVCGFVEDTSALCWQYSPQSARFVRIGGWIT